MTKGADPQLRSPRLPDDRSRNVPRQRRHLEERDAMSGDGGRAYEHGVLVGAQRCAGHEVTLLVDGERAG